MSMGYGVGGGCPGCDRTRGAGPARSRSTRLPAPPCCPETLHLRPNGGLAAPARLLLAELRAMPPSGDKNGS